MKTMLYIAIAMLPCMSCGDSMSRFFYCIDNRTEYNVVLYFSEQLLMKQDSILCPPNMETVFFQTEFWSPKTLKCDPPEISKDITIVVDGNRRHLIKDFSGINNWECSGEKEWSLIMVGKYYDDIRSTFRITENDLK